jgi:transposase InsO family protein
MSHANATLTPRGRLLLARCVVSDRWPLRRAAERFGVARTTAARWADRYRQLGAAGMSGRSSRPHSSPRRTPTRIERRILGLRVACRWAPARIAFRLGPAVSTGGGCCAATARRRCASPTRPPASGFAPAGPPRSAPSTPRPASWCTGTSRSSAGSGDGGGHRVHGRAAQKIKKAARPGYAYLHHAVDDHSRLAYSEILADERQETVVACWTRAAAWFADRGITVARVLTDNRSAYRSKLFAAALGDSITHKRTRPYRPPTNGKVERFNRTLLEEWAYARPYDSEAERVAAYPEFLHRYNHHRGHTALGGLPPRRPRHQPGGSEHLGR